MTAFGTSLVLAALVAQSPAADSLRVLAARLPESALVLETRARPLAVRDAVTDALARDEIGVARGLAAAYAVAWSDSFLVREVARFATWPAERRAAKIWTDSVRRAGVAAYSRVGATAAIAIWRRALRRATAIADTAGIAAVLGNIGAGWLREGELDSAEADLGHSRTLAAAIGDIRVEANAVGTLAGARADRGDLAAGREGYARALALRERIGDTRGVAADHNNLGLLAQAVGEEDEARLIAEATEVVSRLTGKKPEGWLGPGLAESRATPDLLKEAGYGYVMDWGFDDQPVWLRTRAGPILSVPYPVEINDLPALVYRRHTGRQFAEMIVDQFDEMLTQSRKYPLVFSVALHPFVIGQPHRLRAFRDAVRHIMAHRDALWITTPGEIARYCEGLPKGIVPGSGG